MQLGFVYTVSTELGYIFTFQLLVLKMFMKKKHVLMMHIKLRL